MTDTLFTLPETATIPVLGEDRTYPIGRIFCVGRNYAAHAAEMGNEVDREAPFYFTKSAANAILTGATVPYPLGTSDFHHEMELAVAIGAPLFRATPEEARTAVYGYGSALDMTRRDLQGQAKDKRRPWDLGKDLEQGTVFAPLTRSADWDGPAGKRIWLSVDGEIRQDASLDEMIWSVEDILCHLSGYYHLRPGDLILTGTPAGVGAVTAGQSMTGGIDGLSQVELTLSAAE
ncbi:MULTISPECIES: fumarylacetoacetate hydrolase family protein [Rhodobacterales]|jgi:fumarylpyruvate hydrolase|uniref:fumarylacetoacetate hydrolase family protein n=1 Tax=Rhodobacterales TaxID=204455 RepID=UPI00237F8081|nr:fumarylacetoacetate hydrolase family protein [Phaeobacter gallaeciensis]MDE4141539.1 fumarylacetoacetate hydrolase family protein [Phaeobacter gallaeciensis]MDE4149984.1 fumarylacetoacetate hydrolase family protein [Phaeobacter gallaeciensis]MDE4154210.1 fumarylacetoacetate hydrolase family protein [Phaeobacter gallaeciensis]MDE4229621.1 fumarylacetoacetate hydrolase family protein [Phaeobacter gallaeciensis]MDE4258676.1 fumarylacetoacetate hydrolase family protein [Phaeobacter gallaeciensi